MTLRRVLVDTGPLVAIHSARDEHHGACIDQLRSIRPPLLTCWPVLTEAAWLLRRQPSAIQQLLSSLDLGFLSLLPLEADAASELSRLLTRFKKLEAQLADIALLYLAEREELDTVFTLDRRDFAVYRTKSNRRLRVIPA